jgi:hypothetical protein
VKRNGQIVAIERLFIGMSSMIVKLKGIAEILLSNFKFDDAGG